MNEPNIVVGNDKKKEVVRKLKEEITLACVNEKQVSLGVAFVSKSKIIVYAEYDITINDYEYEMNSTGDQILKLYHNAAETEINLTASEIDFAEEDGFIINKNEYGDLSCSMSISFTDRKNVNELESI